MRNQSVVSITKLLKAFVLIALFACSARPSLEGLSTGGLAADDSARALLLRLAHERYDYGPVRQTLGVGRPELPVITIATAREVNNRSVVRSERIVARVHSDRAYPRMGIPPGFSFIWRDTGGGQPVRQRMLVVPENPNYPMTWLRVSLTAKQPGDPEEPIVMVGANFLLRWCDPNCEAEHCTTRDSLRSFSGQDAGNFRQFIAGSPIGRTIR